MSTYQERASAHLRSLFRRYEEDLAFALGTLLGSAIRNPDFEGDNAVLTAWLAQDFLGETEDTDHYLVVAHAGNSHDKCFVGPQSLAMNIVNKARLCAQTGIDTIEMKEDGDRSHLATAEGPFFPYGGAIIRRLGRIEVVISISGFLQGEDHTLAEEAWTLICEQLGVSMEDQVRRLNFPRDDPDHLKYGLGLVGVAHELAQLGLFPGRVS